MSRARSIWLVARREVFERGRSRGFIFSVLFTTLIIVASFFIPALIIGDQAATRIGLVEPAPDGIETAITTTADLLDQEVEIVTYPDREAGATALADEQV